MSPARYASDDDMDVATWCRHLVPDRSVYATGVLGGRRRRVLDSTVLEDAVATQDTVTQLVAAIRRVRRLIPAAHAVKLGAHDYDRPGKPDCDWDDSDAKQALVSGLVNDALAVLAAVATPSWAPSRPRRWRCWRWSPARTWRRASGRGPSGSPGASPATG